MPPPEDLAEALRNFDRLAVEQEAAAARMRQATNEWAIKSSELLEAHYTIQAITEGGKQ